MLQIEEVIEMSVFLLSQPFLSIEIIETIEKFYNPIERHTNL